MYLSPFMYLRIWKHMNVTEAATRGVLKEKVFLEISQNSLENTCARVSFKMTKACIFIKKETLA